MELGPEPPAVVNLLTTNCQLTQSAADATLLDLAARRLLELFQPGPDPADLMVRVRDRSPIGLKPYEQRVFDRVAANAGDRFVPLREIRQRYADGGPNWFSSLRSEVADDAKERGLVHTRLLGTPMVLLCVLAGATLGCFGLLPVFPTHTGGLRDAAGFLLVGLWFIIGPVIALLLLFIAHTHVRAFRLTPAGYAAGSRWLGVGRWIGGHEDLADLPPAAVAIWDRYLAYGVALGENPFAEENLDLRTGFVGEFTSTYTGAPRHVVVRYPWNPLSYTQAGARAFWNVLVLGACAAFWIAVGYRPGWPLPAKVALYGAVGVITVRAAYRLVRSLLSRRPVTLTGQVLAAHAWRSRPGQGTRWIQVVVDDGRHATTRPWLVRVDRANGVRAGDVVTITAQPWNRFVLQLQLQARRHRILAASQLRQPPPTNTVST
jgi:hypothetical protein